jgi:hypothetical protein
MALLPAPCIIYEKCCVILLSTKVPQKSSRFHWRLRECNRNKLFESYLIFKSCFLFEKGCARDLFVCKHSAFIGGCVNVNKTLRRNLTFIFAVNHRFWSRFLRDCVPDRPDTVYARDNQ